MSWGCLSGCSCHGDGLAVVAEKLPSALMWRQHYNCGRRGYCVRTGAFVVRLRVAAQAIVAAAAVSSGARPRSLRCRRLLLWLFFKAAVKLFLRY
jgi:hypothetical protein